MQLHPRILTGPHIRLEPVAPAHEDELRAALDCDPENWAVQIASARGAHWAAWWEALVRGQETSAPGLRRQAFAERVAFRVDARDARSRAAMARLDAVEEEVARRDFMTWTGHRRSSVLFSIVAAQWPHLRAGLNARPATFGCLRA